MCLIMATCASMDKMSVIPTNLSYKLQYLNESVETKSIAITGFATDWCRLRDVTTRHGYGCVPSACCINRLFNAGSDIQRGKNIK